MSEFTYYIFALVVLIVGLLVLKKVATCMIKTVVTIIMVGALAIVYWLYFC